MDGLSEDGGRVEQKGGGSEDGDSRLWLRAGLISWKGTNNAKE